MRGWGHGRPWALRRGWMRLALIVALVIALALAGRGEDHDTSNQPAPAASAMVTGPPETVFDWSSQACAPGNIPDLPVRAFRDYRGQVELILPHFNSWRMLGPSLDGLHVTCRVIMGSSLDPDPAHFNQKAWVASLYTRDGRHIAALVHEEYHGTQGGTCVPNEPTSCWYNAITFARSNDGGRSFQQPPPPAQLVAASPYRYTPGVNPTGVFSPSNIVRDPVNGYYYAMVVSRTPTGDSGTCLMRTADPFKPSTWRAWGGSGFTVRFVDPYRTSGAPGVCTPVAKPEIASMHESLTYNTYLQRFVLVGLASALGRDGRVVSGVYFSLSSDLVHWTPRKLVMRATPKQRFRCGGPKPTGYPSLLDPASPSRTFSTTGRRPYLYFTLFNYAGCKLGLDRDLVRVPVELSR
jgi:hypothetical protein